MQQTIDTAKQTTGVDRFDLEAAETELKKELREVYQIVYKRNLPPIHRQRISLPDFIRFLQHLGQLQELKADMKRQQR